MHIGSVDFRQTRTHSVNMLLSKGCLSSTGTKDELTVEQSFLRAEKSNGYKIRVRGSKIGAMINLFSVDSLPGLPT
jgi:hypothetical protein